MHSRVYSLPYVHCPSPPDEEFVAYYYSVIKQLRAADGCDARLVIRPASDDDDSVGTYDEESGTITIVLMPNPFDVIATILHEVAHHASRYWRRPHGYRWRHAFAAITEEFIGEDPTDRSHAIRRMWRRDNGYYEARSMALDSAVVAMLTETRTCRII